MFTTYTGTFSVVTGNQVRPGDRITLGAKTLGVKDTGVADQKRSLLLDNGILILVPPGQVIEVTRYTDGQPATD